MDHKPKLLLADSDEHTRKRFQTAAEKLGCEAVFAINSNEVLIALGNEDIRIVLLDARRILDTLETLREIRRRSPRVEVAILNEKATISAAVEAIKAGAADYFEKPVSLDSLERFLSETLERHSRFKASIPTLEELEKEAIQIALAEAAGDKIEAARLLGIGKTTLYRKLNEYGSHRTHPRRQRGTNRELNSSAQQDAC